MNPYLSLALRALAFAVLVGVFFYLAIALPGRSGGRLIAMFGTGAWLLFFVEGPEWGTLERTSARPLVIVLGLLLMGGAGLWLWSLRSVLSG